MILERHLKVYAAMNTTELVAETKKRGGVQMLRGMGMLKFVEKEDDDGEPSVLSCYKCSESHGLMHRGFGLGNTCAIVTCISHC